MKQNYKIFIAPLFVLIVSTAVMLMQSCSKKGFLDPEGAANLNEKITFADSASTIEFLNNVYGVLTYLGSPREVNQVGAPLAECSDEADSRWPGGHNVPLQVISGNFTGNWMGRNTGDWVSLYNWIRHANIYLKNVDGSPLSADLKARTKLEARFLKCYAYVMLMRNWGGVPIVGDTAYSIASPNVQRRWDYADCVDYVVKELDDLASKMATSYTGIDYGRATKGACLALKSRLLLSAASPLFNGGSFATDPELIKQTAYPTADPARWQKALEAAQAVVNMGQYQLEEDNTTAPGSGFYNMFLKRINSEYILALMRPFNREIEGYYLTPTKGGSFLQYPTQELVDAFPMKDGKKYTESVLYSASNPYANRDPRFYFTVIYNGALYFDVTAARPIPVYTYAGAPRDGIVAITSNAATWTGYYRRKMADSLLAGNSSGNTQRCLPLIRYAEILLNLAEAANETGQTNLAMQQIKLIRKRAGIEAGNDNNYGLPASPSQAEARDIIRNERFIELAFEEHRYFDLRRWRLGEQYDGKFTTGMRITLTGPLSGGNFTYTRINIRPRYFKTNSYLFPIPQTELALNASMKQNPGW